MKSSSQRRSVSSLTILYYNYNRSMSSIIKSEAINMHWWLYSYSRESTVCQLKFFWVFFSSKMHRLKGNSERSRPTIVLLTISFTMLCSFTLETELSVFCNTHKNIYKNLSIPVLIYKHDLIMKINFIRRGQNTDMFTRTNFLFIYLLIS